MLSGLAVVAVVAFAFVGGVYDYSVLIAVPTLLVGGWRGGGAVDGRADAAVDARRDGAKPSKCGARGLGLGRGEVGSDRVPGVGRPGGGPGFGSGGSGALVRPGGGAARCVVEPGGTWGAVGMIAWLIRGFTGWN